MNKKVGIITLFYKTYNYGAQLQAYALQKAITKLGYEAQVIRFKWYKTQIEQFYRHASKDNYDKFLAFSKSIPHSKHVYVPENIYESVKYYDTFVCGSDQIWGVSNIMPSYVLPQLALSFVPDSKVKIAYAASMGGSKISDRNKDVLSPFIQRLDAVSIRETSAIPFASRMAKKPVTFVVDPTMLLTPAEWDEIAIEPKINRDYIFVYNIGNNAYLDIAAGKLSNKLNCEIKTVSYSPTDSIGPAEFVGLVKYAKYVLTNSFHGTIFSILYHKEFLSFANQGIKDNFSKNIRILDLLELFGLSERLVYKRADLSLFLNLDSSDIEILLNRERQKSFDYLKKSLQVEKENIEENNIKDKNNIAAVSDPTVDYLASIANHKTDNELYYERLLIDKELETEKLSRELDIETTRNNMYCKLSKYKFCGFSLDHDPLLTGMVIIYGAGKIGQLASECFNNNMLCFIDHSDNIDCYLGYKVFKLRDSELRKIMEKHDCVTFLITPVWDFDILETEIFDLFPSVNIISIEKILEKAP